MLEDDSFNIAAAFHLLDDVEIAGNFHSCWQLVASAKAAPGSVRVSFRQAEQLSGPLPRAKRQPRAASAASSGLQNDTESDASSEVDAAVVADTQCALSDSSGCFSVDTDVDDGADEFVKKKTVDRKVAADAASGESAVASSGESAPSAGEDGEGEEEAAPSARVVADVPRAPRHSAGTWTVWENVWFYMTQTPGWTDVKIHVKGPFRQVMYGNRFYSKTLTPAHFGEDADNCLGTALLLRAWALWRAGFLGWAREREGRLREYEIQQQKLVDDISALWIVGQPFLVCKKADKLLRGWAHRVVAEVEAQAV